jgi:8-oxo-dGTP diphosphatase
MQKVGAAVIMRDGRYLIAKRKPGGSLANKWEFPGGKVEEGETPERGLERELFEEFEVTAKVSGLLATHPFENNGKRYLLEAYRVEHVSGEFILHEHVAIAWITAGEFDDYDLADSDRAIVPAVLAQTSGMNRTKHAEN